MSRFESPNLSGLPPLHGGLVGYLGYDVVREVERLPDPPADDLGHPDAALVVIGQFCAFDHWRQRIVLVDNVVVPRPDGVADAEAVSEAPTRAPARGWPSWRRTARRSRPGELVPAPPPGLEKAAADADDDARRSTRRPSRWPRSTSGPGTSSRSCSRSAYDLDTRGRAVRRLPRPAPAQPEPLPLLPALPRGDGGRGVARADGAAARRRRDLAADRRFAATGRERAARPAARGGAGRGPEGAGRAHHAGRPGPQRRRAGRALRHREGRRAHDRSSATATSCTSRPRCRASSPRARGRSTCCGPPCRPGRSRGRPRCGPWRSSTSSSRPSAASTAGSWATSTSRATSTRRSPSAPWSSRPTAGPACRPGAGIVADSDPAVGGRGVRPQGRGTAGGGHGGPRAWARARAKSVSDVETESPLAPRGGRLSDRPRDVAGRRGTDAEAYLQGQLSQDVAALAVGASADSLLLEPDGKLTRAAAGHPDRRSGIRARRRRRLRRGRGGALAPVLAPFEGRDRAARLALPVPARAGGARGGRRTPDSVGRAGRAGAALRVEWLDGDRPARDQTTSCSGCRRTSAGSGAPAAPTRSRPAAIVSGVPAMGTELTAKTIPAEAGRGGAHGELHQGLLHRAKSWCPDRRPRGSTCPAASSGSSSGCPTRSPWSVA